MTYNKLLHANDSAATRATIDFEEWDTAPGVSRQTNIDASWSNVITVMCSNTKAGQTRTTRMPEFWGYPPPSHDYPYYWVMLDTKSKQDEVKVTNLKDLTKFKFWNFDKDFTCGTPSKVAWKDM